MKSRYNVTDAEWEVLKMLWDHGRAIRQSELLEISEKNGKGWKRQTLNTFLVRLEEKALVRRENSVVAPVYSEEEYNAIQMKEAIDQMYGGKVSRLLTAFMERNGLSEAEAEELRRLLDKESG